MSEVSRFIKELGKLRQDIWHHMPDEIAGMRSRKENRFYGIKTQLLIPAGPILRSWGDARNLHESLWQHYALALEKKMDLEKLRDYTWIALRRHTKSFKNYYDLPKITEVLVKATDIVSKVTSMEEYLKLMQECMLYVLRVEMWIDLLIPWYDINELYKKKSV